MAIRHKVCDMLTACSTTQQVLAQDLLLLHGCRRHQSTCTHGLALCMPYQVHTALHHTTNAHQLMLYVGLCRKEQRNLERQIRDTTRLEKVAQKQIREAAKRGDMASAKTLAKELVHTRRVTTRLWTNKAHMMSMNSQLTEQLGMVKVAGTLKQSTQVCDSLHLGC